MRRFTFVCSSACSSPVRRPDRLLLSSRDLVVSDVGPTDNPRSRCRATDFGAKRGRCAGVRLEAGPDHLGQIRSERFQAKIKDPRRQPCPRTSPIRHRGSSSGFSAQAPHRAAPDWTALPLRTKNDTGVQAVRRTSLTACKRSLACSSSAGRSSEARRLIRPQPRQRGRLHRLVGRPVCGRIPRRLRPADLLGAAPGRSPTCPDHRLADRRQRLVYVGHRPRSTRTTGSSTVRSLHKGMPREDLAADLAGRKQGRSRFLQSASGRGRGIRLRRLVRRPLTCSTRTGAVERSSANRWLSGATVRPPSSLPTVSGKTDLNRLPRTAPSHASHAARLRAEHLPATVGRVDRRAEVSTRRRR